MGGGGWGRRFGDGGRKEGTEAWRRVQRGVACDRDAKRVQVNRIPVGFSMEVVLHIMLLCAVTNHKSRLRRFSSSKFVTATLGALVTTP